MAGVSQVRETMSVTGVKRLLRGTWTARDTGETPWPPDTSRHRPARKPSLQPMWNLRNAERRRPANVPQVPGLGRRELRGIRASARQGCTSPRPNRRTRRTGYRCAPGIGEPPSRGCGRRPQASRVEAERVRSRPRSVAAPNSAQLSTNRARTSGGGSGQLSYLPKIR